MLAGSRSDGSRRPIGISDLLNPETSGASGHVRCDNESGLPVDNRRTPANLVFTSHEADSSARRSDSRPSYASPHRPYSEQPHARLPYGSSLHGEPKPGKSHTFEPEWLSLVPPALADAQPRRWPIATPHFGRLGVSQNPNRDAAFCHEILAPGGAFTVRFHRSGPF
jgi:hypothetical protein